MSNLKQYEIDILKEIAKTNSSKYPWLLKQIEVLEVESREKTKVGLYVNFRRKTIDNVPDSIEGTLSSNQVIKTKGLKNGLGFIVDITKGYINYIELFTYDEQWDGEVEDYSFLSIF
jgi:hypothetical protein